MVIRLQVVALTQTSSQQRKKARKKEEKKERKKEGKKRRKKERKRQEIEINHYDNMKPDHDQQSQMAQGMGNCGEHLWLRNGDQASSCRANTDLQSKNKQTERHSFQSTVSQEPIKSV